MCKSLKIVMIGVFVAGAVWSQNSYALNSADVQTLTQSYAQTILKLANSRTGISPSHFGSPGYQELAFLYDTAVNAMLLKASGHQKEAEKVMDYFDKRLNIPLNVLFKNADQNSTYGILKLFREKGDAVGFVNSIEISSDQTQGRGQLEYLTTPGPVSFVLMAFLAVNKDKYLNNALNLGNALLSMQRADGAVYDGDRSVGKVHTEPHVDAINAFYQLYAITKDEKWKTAGDKGAQWFKANVFFPQKAEIYQGIWEKGPSTIFATDVYSWTMAGRLGDLFSLGELEALTNTLLTKSLTRVTLELPGGKNNTMVMVDFTDPKDPQVVKMRRGLHPMGSPEWTGGVILCLQKNAVRFWEAKKFENARYYKALAEQLSAEVLKASYKVNGLTMFPYATGQGISVGHGWETPYFYVKEQDKTIEGGSLVGGWPVLPMNGFNPFVLDDDYFKTYGRINIGSSARSQAKYFIEKATEPHYFCEIVPKKAVDGRVQIVEPGKFNGLAWNAFNREDYNEAVLWAKKVVDEPNWVKLAQQEEKAKEIAVGGLIDYPWGRTYAKNENSIHTQIWKYPLLNEVATAMWILAASHYELGNMPESKKWINRITTEVPQHQIADVVFDPHTGKMDLIDGYWNAVASWKYNPGQSKRDKDMGEMMLASNPDIKIPQTIVKIKNVPPSDMAKTSMQKTKHAQPADMPCTPETVC